MIKIYDITIPEEVIYFILIVVVSFLTYKIIKAMIDKIFNFRIKKTKIETRKQKTLYELSCNILKYIIITIAFVSILSLFGINTGTIVASIGALSLVIGLAFQDTLKDFLSGIFILLENQFAVGDIIEITGFKGEVISLGLKTTKIKSETGEIKIVSNRNIVEVINYSLGDSTVIIDVEVAYDSDLDKVEKVINDVISDLPGTVKDMKWNVEFLGIQSVGNNITYRIMASTLINKNKQIKSKILREIKLALDKNGIKRN